MARPKKLSDADATRLVDSLYEQCGDYGRLKFSELEKHAALLNLSVKAYDLRRNETVLRRIAEIKALEMNSETIATIAYKGLDIDGFLRANRTSDKLKRGLVELDDRWRKLYDYAAAFSKRVTVLTADLSKSEELIGSLKSRNAELSKQISGSNRLASGLQAENAYLRKKIREYLYPALADSVLKSLGEHGGDMAGANQSAIETMTDGDTPASFSESIAADREIRSRETILLDKLRLQAQGDDHGTP